MTEAEWKTCGVSNRMLRRVQRSATPRKARLFGVACGYRVWQYLDNPLSRTAVEVAEARKENIVAALSRTDGPVSIST